MVNFVNLVYGLFQPLVGVLVGVWFAKFVLVGFHCFLCLGVVDCCNLFAWLCWLIAFWLMPWFDSVAVLV